MRYLSGVWSWLCLLALALGSPTAMAASLGVSDAWIRAAPPGAQVMAGYATLINNGDAPLVVLAVQSAAFRMASLHESSTVGGVAKMHELRRLAIAPGASVRLQPGGKHLMLMQPRGAIAVGDLVDVTFLLEDGSRLDTRFAVMDADDAGGHAHE